MPDTSIVPAWTIGSANFQYVIGRDNGIYDQGSGPGGTGGTFGDYRPPPADYPNAVTAETMFLAQITTPGTITWEYPDWEAGVDSWPLSVDFGVTTAVLTSIPMDVPRDLMVKHDYHEYPSSSFNPARLGRFAAQGNPGQTVPVPDGGPFPPGQPNYWQYLEAEESFSTTFTTPVRAYGFYGVDLGDWDTSLTLRIYYSDATTEDFDVPYTTQGTLSGGIAPWNQSTTYVGMLFTKDVDRIDFLKIQGSAQFDVFAYDNFTAAVETQVSIPTPPGPPIAVPAPPSDCVPSIGGLPCPQVCAITVPTQVLTVGTPPPISELADSTEPHYFWTFFQWLSGFGGSLSATGAPGTFRATLDCAPGVMVNPGERQCAPA